MYDVNLDGLVPNWFFLYIFALENLVSSDYQHIHSAAAELGNKRSFINKKKNLL